jgi:hypothetical protein
MKKKKLSLNRETLRRLSQASLGRGVAGGATAGDTDCIECSGNCTFPTVISDSCPIRPSCNSCYCSVAPECG